MIPKLLVSQVNGQFAVKEPSMVAYSKKIKDLLTYFENFELVHISRTETINADALSN